MAEPQTLSAAGRTALIARCRADLPPRVDGMVTEGTVAALRARSAARSEAASLGIEWREPRVEVPRQPSARVLLRNMSAADLKRALTPAQRQEIAARLGGPKSAPRASSKTSSLTKAAAPQRLRTAAEARTDVRTAIAESQGLPAPKPAAAAVAKVAEPKGCHVLRAAAHQPDPRARAVVSSEYYAGREKLAANLLRKGMVASDVIAALKVAPRTAATATTAQVDTQDTWAKAIAANWPKGVLPGFGGVRA